MTELAYLEAAVAGDRAAWPFVASACADGRRLPWSAARHLLELGVPAGMLGQLTGAGDLAIGQVDLRRGGTFEFGGPDRRLILAVRERGVVVDLVALSSQCEDEWALMRKASDFLGGDLLADAVLAGRREVRLFSTPMAWLRGGCAGVCVLDWTPAALSALRGLGSGVTLVVAPGAKAKLQAMLVHGGLPLVAEDRAPVRRAA
jgi:hypothetical protein